VLLEEALEDFLTAGLQAGWSDSTERTYRWHLKRLESWLVERKIEKTDDLTKSVLRTWGGGLHVKWGPATVRQAVMAARAFLRWCHSEGLLASQLANDLKTPKVPKRIQRTLYSDEVLALLNGCELVGVQGLGEPVRKVVVTRNQAIVSLLYDSMLRAAELCSLRMRDLNLKRRQVAVITKGGDEEYARFSERTSQRLIAWLNMRQAAEGVNTIFVGVTGNTPGYPLTPRGLRIIVKRIGERAGVDGVSPHAFRRGGAVQASRLGASTRVIQDLGRWDSLHMVELYTRGLEADDLFDRFSPVESLG
jgi:site-specific recombinase XerD